MVEGSLVPEFSKKPEKFSTFIKHLETHNVVGFTVEVHELTHHTSNAQTMSYTIQPRDTTYFMPGTLPKNKTVSADNLGSIIPISEWKFEAKMHTMGFLRLVLTLKFESSSKNIVPVRPRLFLTKTYRLLKGQLFQVA